MTNTNLSNNDKNDNNSNNDNIGNEYYTTGGESRQKRRLIKNFMLKTSFTDNNDNKSNIE